MVFRNAKWVGRRLHLQTVVTIGSERARKTAAGRSLYESARQETMKR